jgi:3-dehydrosphinganine reductase
VFTCAGAAKPKFFVEMDEQELIDGMVDSYWVQAWTAWVSKFNLLFGSYSDL